MRQSTTQFFSLVILIASLATLVTTWVKPVSGHSPPDSAELQPKDSIRMPFLHKGGRPHLHHGSDALNGEVPSTPARWGRSGGTKSRQGVMDAGSMASHLRPAARMMVDDHSAGPETAAEVRQLQSCGGVTFSLDASNFLVRSDNGANQVDCLGDSLNFFSSGIAGLGVGVFANMPTLQNL